MAASGGSALCGKMTQVERKVSNVAEVPKTGGGSRPVSTGIAICQPVNIIITTSAITYCLVTRPRRSALRGVDGNNYVKGFLDPLYWLGIDKMYFNSRQLLKADHAAWWTLLVAQLQLSAVLRSDR